MLNDGVNIENLFRLEKRVPVKIIAPLYRKPTEYRDALKRDNKTDQERKFYSSSRWRKASLRHRAIEPLCRSCNEQGRFVEGKLTDHIRPLRNGGDPWDEANLQTLCDSCHQAKRRQEHQ